MVTESAPKTGLDTPSSLIGRDREWAELGGWLARAKEGAGGIVFLAGEMGAGKTRLAEECLASHGYAVFPGRAGERTTPPYGPLISALRGSLRRSPGLASARGGWAPYLAVLMPELGVAPRETDRETLGEAIADAFIAAGRTGTAAFLLDDLHWADSATLEILPSLAERLRHEPVALLATYRKEEIPRGHRLRWARNELRRRRLFHEIELAPLSEAETARLAARTLGQDPDPNLARRLFDKTHGIPLYIEEVSRALVDRRGRGALGATVTGQEIPDSLHEAIPIPESLRDAALCRLEGLSPAARAALEVASVAGGEFDLALVSLMTKDDTGLEELLERGFLDEKSPGRAVFRQTLIRETVRNEIPWPRRRSLHRQVAMWLESQNDGAPEQRADHWLGAGDATKARAAFLEAAERSCRIHAYWDATRAALRALEIWPEEEDADLRLDALERLAHCAQISGQLIVAGEAMKALTGNEGLSREPGRYARIQRAAARIHGLQGKGAESIDAHRSAQRAFEEAGRPGEAAEEAMAIAQSMLGAMRREEAGELARDAVRLARASGRQDILARALAMEGYVLSTRGRLDEAKQRIDNALAIALGGNLPEVATEVYRRLGSVLDYASEFPAARETYEGVVNQCRQRGEMKMAEDCMGCLAWVLFRTGEWKRALAVCREVVNLPDPPVVSRIAAFGVMGIIGALRGEVRRARKHLERATALARVAGIDLMILLMDWAWAILGEAEGDTELARESYRRFIESWGKTDDRHDAISALTWAVTFFAGEKADRDVARCAEALSVIASETGNPEAMAAVAYALGETALLRGDDDEAARQFLQSVERMETLSMPFDLARSEYRAGVALSRAHQTKEAARYLTNAYRRMRKLGARSMAEPVANALRALGECPDEQGSPESDARQERGGLTRRQKEVLQLIAEGLTNKEIASRLYLSPRTVEMHAAQVLNRLDCRSRSEAVGKATHQGLLG